jgi:37-kD nucleoid-associated bacterial protein
MVLERHQVSDEWEGAVAVVDAGTFKPVEVIMHPIPRGKAPDDGSDPILYSEAPIVLSADDRAFMQRRLRHSLGGYARPVVEDPSLGSKVPGMVRDLLKSSAKLVQHSCAVAHELHQQQKWISPGGLVMTIIGTLDKSRCVVIAKMEHQEGMRVEQTTNEKGQRTFKAEHLRDLILGDGTRVFKIGIFIESEDGELDGHVVDDQQTFGGVADYFIYFLGCQFRQQADVQTEAFLDLAQKFFIQRTKDDPEANAAYEIALLAEMQSGSARIQPEKFAADHLRDDDQDLFLQRVRDAGLPTKSFRKDVTLIKSRIRRMRIQTERGADVLAPPDMFDDGSVTVVSSDGSDSVITVRDIVKKMSGASGKRTD